MHKCADKSGLILKRANKRRPSADYGIIPQSPIKVVEGLTAENLLADRGYDSNEIIGATTKQGMSVVIPPKKNRTEQRAYDKALYKYRHLVENAFMHLKRWRGIATRYAKNTASFLAAVQIRCIVLWAGIS